MKFLRAGVCTLTLALGLTWVARARQQQDPPPTGTIQGTVTDTSGRPIGGAGIDIAGVSGDTGIASDASGHFVSPALEPGVYDVTLSSSGFKAVQVNNVVVNAGAASEVDAKLEADQP